jgi:hypothetical protein
MIEEKFNEKPETILSELEKMIELVEQPSQKLPSNQRAFVESLIEWIAVKSISFRSVNHPLFKEMVHRANPDFSLPVYHTVKLCIQCLADVYRLLPEHQDKSYCFLLVDGAEASTDVCWRS